jgi:hypothetical protein
VNSCTYTCNISTNKSSSSTWIYSHWRTSTWQEKWLDEGHWSWFMNIQESRTVGTTCQAFATNSMSWAWRYRRPDGPVNVWWSISIDWVGQCTRSDSCHQGRKWLERYVLSRLLHRMLSAQHPLTFSFFPAEGLQACKFYKASLQEDGVSVSHEPDGQ